MPVRESRRSVLPYVVLLAAAALLGYRVHAQRAAIAQLADEARLMNSESRRLEEERNFLLASFATEHDSRQVAFDGVDAQTSQRLALPSTEIDIVYVLAVDCAACALNLPLLDSLARSGARVIGVSLRDDPEVLRQYGATHSIGFPLLAAPGGTIGGRLRSTVTPVTLLMRRGSIVDIHVGGLGAHAARLSAQFALRP